MTRSCRSGQDAKTGRWIVWRRDRFLDHEDGSQEAYMHRNVIVWFGAEVRVMSCTLAVIRQSVVHFTTMPMALNLTSLTASNHSKQSY